MTWTGQSFSAGQVLTATQMNNLQADITGQANGDGGAPKNKLASMDTNSVGESQIVASAISQSKLSTTTGEVSTSGAGPTSLTLAGGEYGFYPQTKADSGTTYAAQIATGVNNTAYTTYISFTRSGGSGTQYAQQRYIQASPPYDLGDGEIPLFIFLLVDNSTRKIIASYIAPEAPWHNNGPTSIRPDTYLDGIGFRKVREIAPNLMSAKIEVDSVYGAMNSGDVITDDDRRVLRDFYVAMKEQPVVFEEITQDIKQADMSVVPHPFTNIDLTGRSVVMLDPLSNITLDLFGLAKESDKFELTKIIRGDFFDINTTPLARSGPPDVVQLGFNWRNTP